MKKWFVLSLIFVIILLSGCSPKATSVETSLTVAAAASMKNVFENDLLPLFREKFPDIGITATYDASGKLQTQIEEGADIDVFFSAATKQMKALEEKGLLAEASYREMLENEIVLIIPKESKSEITGFDDLYKLETIAIGDPESVPAGQYAKELLSNLNLWATLESRFSLGTNVTEVLSWVAEGSADAGIVYATDAASNEKVKVIASAPDGSVSKIIYPVGRIASSKQHESAKTFIEFLSSDEVFKIFEAYGFKPIK